MEIQVARFREAKTKFVKNKWKQEKSRDAIGRVKPRPRWPTRGGVPPPFFGRHGNGRPRCATLSTRAPSLGGWRKKWHQMHGEGEHIF
jgi:hypothetical protein